MRISDWSSDVCSSDLMSSVQACYSHFGGGAIPTRASSPQTTTAVPPQTYSTKKKWNASGLSSRVGRPVPKKLGPAGSSPTFHPCQATASTPDPRPTSSRQPSRRSEEHTSELQSLMRISYAVFCLKKKN